MTFAAAVVDVAEEETVSEEEPDRSSSPSNVTRAFSEVQVRLPELKREIMILEVKGIEKFVSEAEMSRGIASPMVTLLESVKFAVVHPTELSSAQVEPVNPFVHMQLQIPEAMEFVPPFRHVRVDSQEDVDEAAEVVDEVELLGLCLWRTTSSKGITTAAAIMMRPIRRKMRKQQSDTPQHLLPFFDFSFCCSSE